MFDGPDGLALRKDLQEFLLRPEHQEALAEQQKEEYAQIQELKEKELESTFATKLLTLDFYQQKRLRPILKHPVLRRLLISVSNSSTEEFSEWLGNPLVMQMFTQAERLLRKGQVQESDMEHALLGYLSQLPSPSASVTDQARSVVLPTEVLLQPMNEHVQERRKGNEAYQRHEFDKAREYYNRALSILDLVRGSHEEDQKEIDKCRVEVLLNIAAVVYSIEEYGACIELCTRVLHQDPNNIKALTRRSKAYTRRHEHILAKEDSTRAIEMRKHSYV